MSPARATPAFDALVAAHRPDVLRVCRSIVREEHLSLDAAQETFLRLWRRIDAGRGPEDAAPWLRRVAIRVALDHARARRARERLGAPGADGAELHELSARPASPLAALGRAELEERFAAALAELPEGQRAVFLLRHEGGLGLAEIAAALELSRETVKTQFARAALRLQERLARFHDDEVLP